MGDIYAGTSIAHPASPSSPPPKESTGVPKSHHTQTLSIEFKKKGQEMKERKKERKKKKEKNLYPIFPNNLPHLPHPTATLWYLLCYLKPSDLDMLHIRDHQ
jgi:hypothetical protein